MAKHSKAHIAELVQEIDGGLHTLADADAARKLQELKAKLPHDVGGDDSTAWDELEPQGQDGLYKQLVRARDELLGPAPKQRFALYAYVTVLSAVLLASIAILALSGGVAPTTPPNVNSGQKQQQSERANTDSAASEPGDQQTELTQTGGATREEPGTGSPETEVQNELQRKDDNVGTPGSDGGKPGPDCANGFQPTPWKVILSVLLLGALGGCLRLLSSLVVYDGERKLRRSWLPYYWTMPLIGGMLAPVVCLLVLGGIIDVNVEAGTYYFFYGFAAFCGLFAANVLRKLAQVADAMFTKPSSKDGS